MVDFGSRTLITHGNVFKLHGSLMCPLNLLPLSPSCRVKLVSQSEDYSWCFVFVSVFVLLSSPTIFSNIERMFPNRICVHLIPSWSLLLRRLSLIHSSKEFTFLNSLIPLFSLCLESFLIKFLSSSAIKTVFNKTPTITDHYFERVNDKLKSETLSTL